MGKKERKLAVGILVFARALFSIWVWFVLFGSFSAYAQINKSPCPEIDENATAAEQSICWFQREKSGSADCIAQGDGISPCIAQTNAWCAEASLDAEPVTTACLLSAIRMGQLKEAKEIAGYLRSPSKTAEACAAVLKSASIRVITNPAGAEVIVNDKSYGNAPIEVRLIGDWWESQIQARFATDPETVEIAVSTEELLNTFDRKECVFGDLVITGPPLPEPEFLPKNETNVVLTAKRFSVESNDSEWLLWTSISTTAAGVAAGVAATLFILDAEADNRYFKKECPEGCYEGHIDTSQMQTKYDVGNVFIAVGSVCIAAAVTTGILYFVVNEVNKDKADTDLAFSVTGRSLSASF
ncbi:MAG: PEGA domain-containing protein [Deltaproteobacteria bacterium]|nr:PEGA domain-containing protein [Deltaproteobacteria bacterium]